MATSIVRIILYVQEIPKVARFYERYFGMRSLPSDNKAWLELASDGGGCVLALHQASREKPDQYQIIGGIRAESIANQITATVPTA